MAFKFGFEKWAESMQGTWLQQGIEKGIGQGESALLQKQLIKRFGTLSHDLESKLQQASVDQLELWGVRILDAQTLNDVFRADA